MSFKLKKKKILFHKLTIIKTTKKVKKLVKQFIIVKENRKKKKESLYLLDRLELKAHSCKHIGYIILES